MRLASYRHGNETSWGVVTEQGIRYDPMAIEALKAGKHVLCEKLMAHNITQCKEMIKTAEETDRVLTIGHQRHYSLLYSHAQEVIRSGVLGDVKHIRALWHRNFSWPAAFDGKEFEFYFDGEETPRLSLPFRDLFTGTKAPFVKPLVDSGGGGGGKKNKK